LRLQHNHILGLYDRRKEESVNHRIHILGASGSGTTALGKALTETLGCHHHDTDDYYWLPTNPPFQEKRAPDARLSLLHQALAADESWILSGSLCGWGDVFVPYFTLVVFLWLPPEIRMERLRQRERFRYGTAVLPGGARYEECLRFLEWAAEYDEGGLEMRSLKRHEQWMTHLTCPVIRIDGDRSLEEKVNLLLQHVANLENLDPVEEGHR
jgi:adenylate kinase family enzyme